MAHCLRNAMLFLLMVLCLGRRALALPTNCTFSGTICTVAGNGTTSYIEGALATSTGVHGGPTVYQGNLYVAGGGNRIVRVSPSGIVTTVVGNGTNCSSPLAACGDGGLATSAQLHATGAVVFDSSGNMYFSDTLDQRVRKVTATTGIITTIAGTGSSGGSSCTIPACGDGGPATSAQLHNPESIALDAAGNVYFSDSSNQRIRMISAATAIISTVAGNGTAGFSGDGGAATSAEINTPASVFIDSSDNLYFPDGGNNRVRKVTLSTGVITTIAGTGAVGYTGDGGAATLATFNNPNFITVDTAGNVYIGDFFNHVVRKITLSTGIITTIAGNGISGFSGDGGPATSAEMNGAGGLGLDSYSNLYLDDDINDRVRLVVQAGTPVISTVSPTSGTIGTAVTITGTSFGATAGRVTVSGMPATLTGAGWGATSISILIPSGAATGDIVVNAGGPNSNGVGFTVLPATGLAVTSTSLPAGVQDSPYSATVLASGGPLPYTWSSVGSLPFGLNLSSTGAITGTPAWSGTESFTVVVTDALLASSNAVLSITINGVAPSPSSTNAVAYTYDSQGRVSTATYSTSTSTVTVTYTYDSAGNRTSVVTQ